MLVVDAFALFELMRLMPNPAIASQVAELASLSPCSTAISKTELRFGLAIMLPGRRSDELTGDRGNAACRLCQLRSSFRQRFRIRLCADC